MGPIEKIGLGGGCHWCTEAVFQTLVSVQNVEQGYIGATGDDSSLSEGILLEFDTRQLSWEALVAVHLATHSAGSNHVLRHRYRSAFYYFEESQKEELLQALSHRNKETGIRYVTTVLPFQQFVPSRESLQEYFRKHPHAPFCQRYIRPKLGRLKTDFPQLLK